MTRFRTTRIRAAALATAALALGSAVGPALGLLSAPLEGEPTARTLPPVPADGTMGFVISRLVLPVIHDKAACPEGPALTLRQSFVESLSPQERARLLLKENEPELTKRWQAQIFGPNGTNICSNPDMFERPLIRTLKSPNAWGFDLDGDGGKGGDSDEGCAQEDFTTPTGEPGIDNQEYRVLGCMPGYRGEDGLKSEYETGTRQFFLSGEWTQVILVRGIDSLEHDPSVEVIYANTPDRPAVDSSSRMLPGSSFTISDKPPRRRNVLKGRIDNGVLTTEPADIRLAQTWGQGGARDIRGNRTTYDLRKGRLRLELQNDGSALGMLGGYRPVFELIQSPAIGGAGSGITAGIDCAGQLRTLLHFADGIKDPKTGKCSGVSAAYRIEAIPAFVNDVPAARTAAR